MAYLIDVLMRRLSEGLEVRGIEVDRAGRTEEEQVGQEDETPDDYVDNPAEKTRLSDAESPHVDPFFGYWVNVVEIPQL